MAFCTNCGTPLAEGANNCTNCGAAVSAPAAAPVETPVAEQYVPDTAPVYTAEPVSPQPPATEVGKGMAIASLVCGIVSLVCTGGILSVLALIFGIVAKKQGNKSGMSTAGIILGAIGCALCVIFIALYIVGLVAAISTGAFSDVYYYY